MKRLLGLLLLTSALHAEDSALFRQAQQALAEGIPQVGIQKLQLYLAGNPHQEETRLASLELAKAYLSLGQTASARKVLDAIAAGGDVQFLLLQSWLADARWPEVLDKLTTLPPNDSPYYAASVFARAEARRGLQQMRAADQDYQTIENDPRLGNAARLRRSDLALQLAPTVPVVPGLSADAGAALQKASTLLLAQSSLLTKNYPQAERLFRPLLKDPSYLGSADFATVYLGLAQALAGQNHLDDASDLLETFIEEHPLHERLADAFEALNTIYQREKNPSQSQLRRWSRDGSQPPRQALSIYYQSQFDLRDKGPETALATLAAWLEKFSAHPLRASVLLRYGELLVSEKKTADGIRRLMEGLAATSQPSTSGELHAALATAFFASNRFDQAGLQFRKAAQLLQSSAQNLLYNRALSWLRNSNFDEFLAAYRDFSDLFPNSSLRPGLLLEEGFFQARSKDLKKAQDTLNLFIRDFPEHPRIPDAHLALAEISLQSSPADTRQQLDLTSQSMPAKEVAGRAAYIEAFLVDEKADRASDAKKRIAKCEAFLKQYPDSAFEAEIRFKLGEAYFSEKDYTAAGTQFELISTNFPESPLLEQARFLAGQSAIRTMNPSAVDGAISLFEQVVRMRGPLQTYARFEQANVKKNSGAYNEALVLYNDLLAQTLPDDLQASTLAAKAETLYLQGGEDPQKIEESVKTFDQLAALPGISRYWRNLALYKKGKGLQWLGKKEEMLTSYYDALAAPAKADETPEYYWFYRAGFDAAESLERDEQWQAAIAIYRKLADAKGPRSAEAEARIKRLRLEHFIWN